MLTMTSSSILRRVCGVSCTLLLSFAAACDNATEPAAAQVTATVDGRAWSADADSDHPFAIANGTTLELRAVRTETAGSGQLATSTITITINDFHGIGQYTLGGTSGNHAVYSYRIEPSEVSYSTVREGTGTLTIGSIDARGAWVAGSFQFQAGDTHGTSIAVSDGQFIGPLVGY
jgi:hypothetical protein